MKPMSRLTSVVLVLLGLCSVAAAADISSYAFVQHDGSLRVDGKTIRLFGIYIPPTEDSCRMEERPVLCSSRAALALEFKIAGFVRCTPQERLNDGSFTAVCRADGDDLGAFLLQRGWALALPDAPFEYVALERIAQQRNVGVWGFTLEPTRPKRR